MGAEDVRAAAGAVAATRREAEGEQDELFVPAGRRLTAEEARAEGEARRGRGRPKGAANLMTRDLRKLLLTRGEAPQLAMLAWAQLSPEEIAARLGCTKAEGFDRWLRLNAELSPYIAPRLAPTDANGASVPPIAVFIGGHQAGAGDVPPWMRTIAPAGNDIVEYQALGAPAAPIANANPQGEDE